MKIYRQGDVLLIEVKSIPKDAVEQPIKGEVVLAYGEVTGHKHRFEDAMDVRMFGSGGSRYLDVAGVKLLIHEEHSTVTVPPGKYLVPQQVEFTPAALRNVAD
jgi:hypothetical protein